MEVEPTGLTDEGAAPEPELPAEEVDAAGALLLEKEAAPEPEPPEEEEEEDEVMLLEVKEDGGIGSARSTPEAQTSSDTTATPTPSKGRRSLQWNLQEATGGMNGSGTIEDSVVDDQTEEMGVEVREEALKLTAAEVSKVTAIKERGVIKLVPHKDAAGLADLIRTTKCKPYMRIIRVHLQKQIEALLRHCRRKWEVAWGTTPPALCSRRPGTRVVLSSR